jgi:acetyltransferase-like isoleucine patch superfamily enzyme
MKQPLVIIGAGGLGKEIACLVSDLTDFYVRGFYNDGLSKGELVLGKYEILGKIQSLQEIQSEVSVVIAFGNPKMRKKCWDALKENSNIQFPNLIHPSALIMNAERIQLGMGVIVFPLAVLTTDLSIGNNVVVHTGASVHHDVSVGNHSVIMPGARIVMSEQFAEASFIESNYFKPHSF